MIMGTGAAIIGAGALSAGASIWGSSKAADAQEKAAKRASQTEWRMYQQSREDLAPWRQAGTEAVNTLAELVKAGPGEFTESPGYQWTLSEGQRGITNALSAMGRNRSGAHLRSATAYAENLASTEYDNFLKRWYASLNPWENLAGLGQNAAGQTTTLGANAAGNIGRNQLYSGQAQAGNYINTANVLSGTITGGANQLLYLNALRNLQQPTPSMPTTPAGYGYNPSVQYGLNPYGYGR